MIEDVAAVRSIDECVKVLCECSIFPLVMLSAQKLSRFLSVVSLAGEHNAPLICWSTFAQRSCESTPLFSTSVGVNV